SFVNWSSNSTVDATTAIRLVGHKFIFQNRFCLTIGSKASPAPRIPSSVGDKIDLSLSMQRAWTHGCSGRSFPECCVCCARIVALNPPPSPSQEGSNTGWPVPLLGGVRGGWGWRQVHGQVVAKGSA